MSTNQQTEEQFYEQHRKDMASLKALGIDRLAGVCFDMVFNGEPCYVTPLECKYEIKINGTPRVFVGGDIKFGRLYNHRRLMTFPQIDPEQLKQLNTIALELNQPVDTLLHKVVGNLINAHNNSINKIRHDLADMAQEFCYNFPFELTDIISSPLRNVPFEVGLFYGHCWLIKTASNEIFFVIEANGEDGVVCDFQSTLVEGDSPTDWLNKINESAGYEVVHSDFVGKLAEQINEALTIAPIHVRI